MRLSASHTFFSLSPLGLEAARSRKGAVDDYVFAPLTPRVYGPAEPAEAGRYELFDAAALQVAIRSCAERQGRARQATLVLEGPLVRHLVLPLPYVPSDQELRTAVQSEVERYAVFAGGEVAFDYNVLKHEGERLSLLITAMRRDLLDSLMAAFDAAKVELVAVEPAAVALVRALANDYKPFWDVSGESCGIVALLPFRLEVSTWAGGELRAWRSLYMNTEALRKGDATVFADAQLELQRTAIEMPVSRWLLIDLPESLESAVSPTGQAKLTRQRRRPQGSASEWLEGALSEREIPPRLNLLPQKEAPTPTFTRTQLAGLGAFGAILLALLAASLGLDSRAHKLEARLAGLQSETEQLQTQIQHSKQSGDDGEVGLQLARSAAGASAFAALRDATPSDTWIQEASMLPNQQLRCLGVSLSRHSPVVFAEELAREAVLSQVALPELRRDKLEGKTIYRFTLTATLKPENQP